MYNIVRAALDREGPLAKASSPVRAERRDADWHPTHEEIAEQAYAIYLANGAQNGRDLQDWFEAEQLLTSRKPRAPREESVATEQYESADLEERTPG